MCWIFRIRLDRKHGHFVRAFSFGIRRGLKSFSGKDAKKYIHTARSRFRAKDFCIKTAATVAGECGKSNLWEPFRLTKKEKAGASSMFFDEETGMRKRLLWGKDNLTNTHFRGVMAYYEVHKFCHDISGASADTGGLQSREMTCSERIHLVVSPCRACGRVEGVRTEADWRARNGMLWRRRQGGADTTAGHFLMET